MSRNLPKGQGRRQNSGRDIVNPVSFNQMQGLMLQTIDMSVSLIKLPTIRNSQSSLQLESITLGNLTQPIIGGRASFPGVGFFNGGASAVSSSGTRSGTITESRLDPLTNNQINSL